MATTTEDVPMTDPTTDNDIEEKKKAANQVDFYFADANLPYDRFMWTLHTANPEHWVDLSTVSGFKRMRGWKSKGDEWLLDALKQFAEIVEVGEGTKIRRKGEVRENAGFERSIYAKGFPDETPNLQFELENFFSQFGKVNMVRMRRDKDKKFKNSVFCEFSTDEAMEAFLALDPKPKYNDQDLKIMSKKDYCDEKIKEKNIPADKVHHWSQVRAGHTGFNAFREMEGKSTKGGRGKGAAAAPAVPQDLFMEFMGKQVQVFDKDPNVAEGEEPAEPPAPAANSGRGGGRGKKAKEVKQAFVKKEGFPYVIGASVRFTLSEGVVMLPFNSIKEPLKEALPGTRPFIAYERGKTTGVLGFDNPLTDEEVEKIKEAIPQLVEKDVTWERLGEEEEKEYQFKRALEFAQKTLNPDTKGGKSDGKQGGRGGGRGGGGGRTTRSSAGRGGDAPAVAEENGTRGEKRKRPIEPEGGLGEGERNIGIPTIATSSTSSGNPAKKQKTDEV